MTGRTCVVLIAVQLRQQALEEERLRKEQEEEEARALVLRLRDFCDESVSSNVLPPFPPVVSFTLYQR